MNETVVGFRVKSGWAVAVLIGGAPASPVLLDVRRVQLSDPAVPASVQPFHAGLERPGDQGSKEVARLVAIVERFAERSVADLLKTYTDRAGHLAGAGVVVGSQVDPATIKQDHIRAHAEEGRLFRSVIVDAAKRFGLNTTVVSEKNLHTEASAALRQSIPLLQKAVAALGRDVEGGWRAEHKGAALAALMACESELRS